MPQGDNVVYWSISVDEISPHCFLNLIIFVVSNAEQKCVLPNNNKNEIKLILAVIYLNSYFNQRFF